VPAPSPLVRARGAPPHGRVMGHACQAWQVFSFLLAAVAHACMDDPASPKFSLGRDTVQRISRAAESRLQPGENTFMKAITAFSARATLKYITSKPHVAGTQGDLDMAHYVQERFIKAGIKDAVIDPQEVLLAYPVSRSLSLIDEAGHPVVRAGLSEHIVDKDATSDTWWRNHTFNGYSPSGSATAPIVYANFGLPEDFAALRAAGVSVEGAIVLMRYGRCFRGLKAKNAQEAGGVAAIIYSDPEQDGYAQGSVFPEGPWRPPSSVQRGSIQFISTCAGDPARAYAPHDKTVEEVCGYKQEDLIPQIPVLPISYADVLPFLRSLGGPEAPPSFRGALNITYRMGPTQKLRAHLTVENTFQKSPVWNVIAKIPGSSSKMLDQPVILGNHRDAWVYGAADPNSGTAQMIEVAKGLGALLKTGWRPARTIILCSWSGEEYGLLGSTAWAEVNGDSESGEVDKHGVLSRALAYINVDTGVSGTKFHASGTPSLGRLLAGVLGQVKDPRTKKPLSDNWGAGELTALGSGSDYTAFIDHLGIASLDMAFSPESGAQYGVYHSVYDSFSWMATQGDPSFGYHVAMAHVWGLVALRLAGTTNAPLTPLPFDIKMQADAIGGYIAEAMDMLNQTTRPRLNFTDLQRKHRIFNDAAKNVMDEVRKLSRRRPRGRASLVKNLNDRLAFVERKFLTVEGLPGRKWFRHCLQAPGLYTGYAAKTLPGVTQAISDEDWSTAQAQMEAVGDRLVAAAAFLTEDGGTIVV